MEKQRKLSIFSTESKAESRSNKARRSRSSKSSRESKGFIIKVEQVDEENTTNYRESITNLFFDSFLDTIIIERIAKHGEDLSSTSLSGPMSTSTIGSHESVIGSADSATGISGITLSKTGSRLNRSSFTIQKDQHNIKYSHFSQSTQSVQDSSFTNISYTSCASSCTCIWKIVFKNGNIYEGQTNGTLMHGKGVFYWIDGSIYKGDFKDGYPWGQGKLVLPDLSTYEGEFCMGFFHGHGIFNVKSTPLLYNGEWKYAQKNGKGWLLYKTNNWYEGDWVNNKRHGYGFRQYENGSTYKGNWLYDKIDGEGCMFWSNNDCYMGEWSNGYQNGYGEYTWSLIAHHQFVFPNYNWYKGNWVNGYRTGAGIMNLGHESGAKLAGTWEMNRKHGPGFMVCGNGMILQRNPLFKDDKPSPYQKPTTAGNTFPGIKSSTSNWMKISTSEMQAFRTISEQIKTKENLNQLSWDSIMNITRSGTNIKMQQYIKLLEKNTGNAPPLKIPIHNIIHDVDMSYFVHTVQQVSCVVSKEFDISTLEINHMINRDIGVTEKHGVSIVEIDEMLAKNPKSCLETVHNPWEPIYFWQFLQALVCVASILYSHIHKMDYTPTSGFMYHMFKAFLDIRLFPHAGKVEGNCLTHLKDLVPISSVYRLYKEVGEPHTTEEFLKNTCLKKGRGPPCYKIINNENNDECVIQTGTNIVGLNNEVVFSETSHTILKYDEDTRYDKQCLYTFTQLGKKLILKCLAKICPQTMTNTGRIILQYRLSFIEFYETILLLSYEKAEQERVKLIEELKGPSYFGIRESKGFSREMSKMSTHSAKKKKLKK